MKIKPSDVKKVYVVFKTHLDIGFTNFAEVVKQNYLSECFDQAIMTASQVAKMCPDKKFVWTVGSWLATEGLESSDKAIRTRVEAAIRKGILRWHGMPFTTHSEFTNPDIFEYGLGLAQKLDKRFGLKTVAAKLTDVPGHTIGIIEPLKKYGIQYLHIGINPASAMPEVPELFNWQNSAGQRITVAYQKDYGQTLIVPQSRSALYCSVRGDNRGVQTFDEVMAVYTKLEAEFPNAQIITGTLDDFYESIKKIVKTLPTVTQEIGDSWIHGVGSDPVKVAQYRQLCRWQANTRLPRQKCEKFFRNLSIVAEHTWGMNENVWLDDYDNYLRKDFQKLRRTKKTKLFEKSWQEQRDYITNAVKSLPNAKLIEEAEYALKQLHVAPTPMHNFAPLDDTTHTMTDNYKLRFDTATGAINAMKTLEGNHVVATSSHKIGEFMFQTFSRDDYDRFMSQYLRSRPEWAIKDFSKPGLPDCVESKKWYPESCKIYKEIDSSGQTLLCRIKMPKKAVQEYGCPADVEIIYAFPRYGNEINISCKWFNKQASRLPQAAWFSINPEPVCNSYWILGKLGESVDSRDIVKNGGRKLHAVTEDIVCRNALDEIYKITTLDAPLVAVGEPSLLLFDNRKVKNNSGVHFNLYNNTFGTNFPMWFDEDVQFRFTLKLNRKF